MQFVLIAYDHRDKEALNRRLAARDHHVRLGDQMRDAGQLLYAVALLDDASKMIGSIMIVDLPSRRDVDKWLSVEPYVVSKVWDKIEIIPCRVGPSFSR